MNRAAGVTMAQVQVRPDELYAWKGQSLLVVNRRGECAADVPLSGFYFREARYLSALVLTIDGERPWLCQAGVGDSAILRFDFVHPELTSFGGGGTGVSGDEQTTNARGIPHRALDIRLEYRPSVAALAVSLRVANRARVPLAFDVGWSLAADFADVQEAQTNAREQSGEVSAEATCDSIRFTYGHPELPYRTDISAAGPAVWRTDGDALVARVQLEPQQHAELLLHVVPHDYTDAIAPEEDARRGAFLLEWSDRLTRVSTPGNTLAERILTSNFRAFASFPLLQGREDEWLALQAGMPVYPALFGRDTITAGWQAALLDRGESLDASLTRLGRMQSDRVDDWRDEEPGRIPYQVRQGPLARLNVNPYSAYYADFASPLMFVVALAHLYAWTGERTSVAKHWDSARRILEWARTYGDRNGDGYLEYLTRSSRGTKNQGWKDSGDAIVYEDGSPVRPPIATCEIQGYWYAAQQLMAILSAVMGEREDAEAYWRSAAELKARFNRDWWSDADRCPALALDADGRQVRAVTSNAGHCIAAGIIDDEHLPAVVGRLFESDMFSGWGVRTLSSRHRAYDPISYHRGSVWAVENATIAFGLRRFGFDARALDIARALFDLAELYPDWHIPETVGGYDRAQAAFPGAYPRANTPQLWNASGFALLVHTMLGLQPVAPLDLLVVDPVLPSWLPEVILRDLRIGGARATLRFWRADDGVSHVEVLNRTGTLRVLKQPPPESLNTTTRDRFRALTDRLVHR